MRIEESIGIAIAIAVSVVFLVFFLVGTFVSSGAGFSGGTLSPTGPVRAGTTTVVKLPNGKTATVTVPAVTTTGP